MRAIRSDNGGEFRNARFEAFCCDQGLDHQPVMNAWLPQASYPCGNFSDTSSFKLRRSKGSIGHTFTVRIRTRNQNQTSFYPFVPHEISVLIELILGHLRYLLTDVPPQPNSPPDNVFRPDRPGRARPWSQKRGDGSKYEYMQSFFAGIFFFSKA